MFLCLAIKLAHTVSPVVAIPYLQGNWLRSCLAMKIATCTRTRIRVRKSTTLPAMPKSQSIYDKKAMREKRKAKER
jgi:hypothetical protein